MERWLTKDSDTGDDAEEEEEEVTGGGGVTCNDGAVAMPGEYYFFAKGGPGEQKGAGHGG